MIKKIKIIGGGLAGVEAAYQLLKRGAAVDLYEMRPDKMTPAHETGGLAELICSNSLRSERVENAAGVLKLEMQALDSILLRAAQMNRVPAGFALAVDRVGFSETCEILLSGFGHFNLIREEVKDLDPGDYDAVILASGPLTSEPLHQALARYLGETSLYFYDAQAPIVEYDSIDGDKVFRASRYQEGDGDYINCPMSEEEYRAFVRELVAADTVPLRDFENLALFEGCLPVEEMARRGEDTLRHGPLKPFGLDAPDGSEPYAVVQLRQDNRAGTHYNLTGFQTRLTFPEQKRVFGMIPGLEDAVYVRYGVMHRNSFIQAPKVLDLGYRVKDSDFELMIVGQLSGVEGYLESGASGLLAAGLLGSRLGLKPHSFFDELQQRLDAGDVPEFFSETLIGSLNNYIVEADSENFQPSKSAFGLCRPLEKEEKAYWRQKTGVKGRGRRPRRLMTAARALQHFDFDHAVEKILEEGFSDER